MENVYLHKFIFYLHKNDAKYLNKSVSMMQIFKNSKALFSNLFAADEY